jgi:XTP/dITP diphosphohydrolase
MKLLIATNNVGKIKELHELLADLPIELKSLREFENVGDVEETGATFEDNAVLKAREYALQTNLWSVADDSGLEVDALGGAPGVFSARYGGEGANDAEKIEKLLREIGNTKTKNRSARFVCVMAIADQKGEVKFVARGVCEGKIAEKQAGNGGFGYDPVFIPAGFENTFGELSSEIKRQISHRARASAKIIRYLRDFIVV